MTEPKTAAQANDDAAHGRIRDGIDTAKDRVSSAYEQAREQALDTVDRSREKAREAARQTADAIEANPVGMLVGGLALGALVAAVLPRSQREKELLAPVGRRVGAAATAAAGAAREAGRQELASLGLTGDGAREQAKSLFQNLAKAAASAGKAAADAGREEVRGQR